MFLLLLQCLHLLSALLVGYVQVYKNPVSSDKDCYAVIFYIPAAANIWTEYCSVKSSEIWDVCALCLSFDSNVCCAAFRLPTITFPVDWSRLEAPVWLVGEAGNIRPRAAGSPWGRTARGTPTAFDVSFLCWYQTQTKHIWSSELFVFYFLGQTLNEPRAGAF